MIGYINFIFQSLILSITMVFFLVEDCKDKTRGFFAFLALELINNYILFRILWQTEVGIALPQVMIWRIVWYVIYMTFRLGWFRIFTKNSYRNFLLTYFYIWTTLYTVFTAISGILYLVLPEKLAVDAMSTMPKTGGGLVIHLLLTLISVFFFVWLKNRNWLQKLSTNFLCFLFAFIFTLADVGSSFLLVRPQIKSITFLGIFLVNMIFLLTVSYFAYVNYLKSSAQKENEQIRQIMERQYQAYVTLSNQENQIRQIRHDLANHLQVIKDIDESKRKALSEHYQLQLSKLYKELTSSTDCKEQTSEIKHSKTISSSAAWGVFTIFLVDIIMVIIVSQLVLTKVFTYESILIMEFALIAFIILHILITLRRTKKENAQLTQRIHDTLNAPDMTKTLHYIDDVIHNLETFSIQEEENALEQLDRTKFAIITGNQILDSMLWHKSILCKELSIELEMEWNLDDTEIGMDDMDIVGLTGNLLDNAIEACSRVDHRTRFIHVKSKKQANIMSIRVRNTKNESEEPIKVHFRTLKSDAENHGFGMKIIRSIVDKYDGTIQYQDDKTEFVVLVNLQV